MDSPRPTEVLSQAEIRRRLDAIREHSKSILRIAEIRDYIGTNQEAFYRCFLTPNVNARRKIDADIQLRVSNFLQDWESGKLVKAKVDGTWKIVRRGETLAQVAAASGAKADARVHTLTIDRDTLGIRFVK